MKRKGFSILFALVLVLSFSMVAAVPVMAAETEVWVDDDYDSSTLGWGTTHFDNIQDGIDAVAVDGMVYVADGTYDLTASIIVNKSVSLIGDISDPENVVINAGTIPMNSGPKPPDRDKDGFQVAANNVVIRGFKIVNALTVVGGVGDGWQNAGITVGGDITLLDWLDPWNVPLLIDGGTFSDNIIENCSHGIYLAMSKNIVVADNTIRNSTCVAGRESYDGEGIVNWNTKAWVTYQDPTGNVIEGNVIEDCERIGICLGAWGERFSVSGTVIRNNTIRNSQKWAGIALMYIDGPLTITGNDISDNPEGISILGGDANCTNIAVNFNNIAGNTNYGMNNGGTNVIDATNNWWGHASGPSGPDGRVNKKGRVIGKGDAILGNVDWDPCLPQPINHTKHDPVPPGLR